MKKLLYLPVLIGTLLFLGCEKDDDPQDDAGNYQTPLPAATTYGAGTFACYVDGKAYIAKKNDITAFSLFRPYNKNITFITIRKMINT